MPRFIIDHTKFERCRKKKGAEWTATHAADKAGIHDTEISAATQKRTLREDQAIALGKVLGVPPEDFGFWLVEEAEGAYFCDLHDIVRSYETLGNGDVVCIASADGFLEVQQPKLMQSMLALVGRGVDVSYVYPSGGSRSAKDYLDLRRRYLGEAGTGAASRVRGFEVPLQHQALFGWNTRYIVIFQQVTAQILRVRQAFIYTVGIAAKDENDARNQGTSLWVRQPRAQAEHLAGILLGAIDPVPDLEVLDNRMHRELQQCYREVFGRQHAAQTYRRFRDHDAAKALIAEITSRVGRELPSSCDGEATGRETRLLDIGTGDGVLFRQVKETLSDKTRFVTDVLWPVLLDSTIIPSTDSGDPRADAYVKSLVHPFEVYECSSWSFDLIISIHAFYLIDPSYIKKAYRLLAPKGHLFIVTSPRNGNAINALSCAVDEALVRLKGWRDTIPPSEGEKDRTSLRVYSEQLIAEANRCFGNRANVTQYPFPAKRDAFLTKSGDLTKAAKEMIAVFADRVLTEKELVEFVYPRARVLLTEMCEGDNIRNEVVVVHLSKPEIGKGSRMTLG